MPEQASNFAVQSDALFFTLLFLGFVFTVLVGVLIFVLAIRYRRGHRVDRTRPMHHNTILELSWSLGPMFLALAVFVWSAKLFAAMFGPAPKNAVNVFVVGKQWMWHIQHANGIRENNELHVPLGRPVRLTMISQDVIHDFSVPAFRVKRDVIPGTYSTIWFTPTQTGRFHMYCAQYCGTNHSEMTGYVYVMEPTEFQKWLATGGQRTQDTQPIPQTMVEQGAAIYAQQGCGNCHDADGMNRGPSLAGLYGSPVRLASGQTVLADDAYLRRSIMDSNEQIVAEYQQIMPSYKGQLTEEQVLALIEYMKALAPGAGGATGATGLTGPGGNGAGSHTGVGTPRGLGATRATNSVGVRAGGTAPRATPVGASARPAGPRTSTTAGVGTGAVSGTTNANNAMNATNRTSGNRL